MFSGGLVVCGVCQAPVIGAVKTLTHGRKVPYYSCHLYAVDAMRVDVDRGGKAFVKNLTRIRRAERLILTVPRGRTVRGHWPIGHGSRVTRGRQTRAITVRGSRSVLHLVSSRPESGDSPWSLK